MVLQGLQHSLMLGWLFGVLPLKSPTGLPEQANRKHPFSLFLLSLFLLNLLFRFDFYIAHNSVIEGESKVSKFLDLGLLVGESCFDCFFRLHLAFRSKLLVKLLKTLESDMKKFAPSLKLSAEDKTDWKKSERVMWATLLFHFVSGSLMANWAWNSLSYSGSSFGSFLRVVLPKWLYVILFYLFGELPIICCISVAFSLVIVAIFHLFWIFYDFCECLEEQIAIYNGRPNEEEKSSLAKHYLGEVENYSVFSVAASAMQIQKQQELGREPLGKDKVMGKLEHLKMVCGQFDKVCGPLLLGLIVRAVYVLVSSANSILLYENPEGKPERRAKNMLDMFLFQAELAQLWLLPLGAVFRKKIIARKEKLAKMVIFMTNLEARTDMRNVITAFTEWDWTLTGGPGFFAVDRSLLSGVVSSLMTYVTIIFQLNTDAQADDAAAAENEIAHSRLNSSSTSIIAQFAK